MKLFSLVITMLWLVSCATAPELNTAGATQDISPSEAVAGFKAYQGQRVIWGGVIIQNQSLAKGTRLEVLAYPLSGSLEPKTYSQSLSRFIIQADSFLEPVDYSRGRQITVVGRIMKTATGSVGSAEYTYPVLQLGQIYLWPREERGGHRTPFSFGLGFGIGIGL